MEQSYEVAILTQLNIWADKYAYYNEAEGILGYRWPADRADEYAPRQYKGTNSKLCMGTLCALPLWVTAQQLRLRSPEAIKLFYALQVGGAAVPAYGRPPCACLHTLPTVHGRALPRLLDPRLRRV